MRAIDRVVERLEGVKFRDGNFTARCPAHEDAEPSLSIGEGDDDRVLLKCFAGCTAEDIVAALGLEMSDLFADGGEGGVIPLITRAQVHTPDTPELKLVKGGRENPENVTLEAYAEYVKLPVEFLKQLGLRELHYVDQRAVKIPYLDEKGEEACVRFRISLGGQPKIKSRKNDKQTLYGLQSLGEMRKSSFVILVEGESDTQVGWYHNQPVLGVPGAAGFRSEWAELLDGFEEVFVVVEPGKGGKTFWERFAAEGKLQERLYRVELASAKDLRDLHIQDPDRFAEHLQEALATARHWMDIAETETLEHSRKAWEKCSSLAAEEDILERFYETLHASGVAGEENIIKILYLSLTSRRLDRPVSVAVKGPSSGGKSYLVEQVSKHFPESAVYALTGMSEKTLAYSEEPIKHRFLVLYEASGMNSDFQTYLIRSLLSEGRLRYETLEKGDKGIEARVIEREGPTGLIVTTTLARLHAENETRMISVTVTDTPDQTSQILEALADEDLEVPDREEWISLQEWIEGAAQRVTIPFSKELARLIPPVAVRLRRDFKAILNLVKAHALLHQHTREIDSEGRVIATVEEDYAAVRELVADLVAEGVEASVSETMRETVAAVGKLLVGAGEGDDSEADEDALFATVRQVGDALALDRSAAQRRLYDAASRGYLKNLESRKGRTARYRVGDPLPEDVVVLPTPRELTLCTCAPVHVGSGGYDPPLPPRRLTTDEVLTIRRLAAEGMAPKTALESVLAKG